MTGNPFNWSPCIGCTCPNHYPPSHVFPSVRRTLDDPNLARLTRSNDEPIEGEVHTLGALGAARIPPVTCRFRGPFRSSPVVHSLPLHYTIHLPSGPSDTVPTLRAMIASYEAEILDINTAESRLGQFIFHMKNGISLARQELGALVRQERKHISEAILERRRLLHPVRRLPTEILLRIFRSTIEFPISRSITMWGGHWDVNPTENTLWSIERVCKLWRTVALSFPELWSSMNIVIDDDSFGDDSFGNAYIRRLGMQLHRSRNYPLELSVWNDDDYSHFTKLPLALTAILYSFSTRVESLHLYLTSEMFCAIPSLHLSFPSLKSVSFPYGRLLHRLHVVEVPHVSHSFHLPWTQITHFSSEHGCNFADEAYHQPKPVLDLMRKLIRLEECHLRIEFLHPSCIDHLQMEVSRLVSLVQLLEKLTLPALKDLQVSCGREELLDSDDTFTAICDLLKRSGPLAISVLHFDHADVLDGDFLEVLHACPTLEDIRLTSVNKGAIRDETLLQLTLKVDGSTPLVPRLHMLHISGKMSFDMQTFVDMVESRWTLAHVQSPPLWRLSEINLCRFIDADDGKDEVEGEVERVTVLSALDVYKEQGMNVTLSTKVQTKS
ncbi:hypothetical protein EDD85DRAFT_1019896 [Armillaria nabsnona]|nr:hypothetical protein EDD85DRAFT_1019896 [Armillaria nabsnona]